MPKPKLTITDTRMLKLMDMLHVLKIIKSKSEFAKMLGMERQNINNIKNGHQSFTIAHISSAAATYNVNTNWIFGLEKEIFRTKPAVRSKRKYTTSSI